MSSPNTLLNSSSSYSYPIILTLFLRLFLSYNVRRGIRKFPNVHLLAHSITDCNHKERADGSVFMVGIMNFFAHFRLVAPNADAVEQALDRPWNARNSLISIFNKNLPRFSLVVRTLLILFPTFSVAYFVKAASRLLKTVLKPPFSPSFPLYIVIITIIIIILK